MSDELALAPKDLNEAKALSTILSKSALLAADLRGKEADVLQIIMMGREMGMGPMRSLRAFDVIKGRLAMRPEAMVAEVRSKTWVEFIRCVESTPTSATWESRLKGQDFTARTTFTMEAAKVAGLAGQDNYRKWPEQMLQWRAASLHCKRHHSDIIMGLYSTEEVESFGERDVTPAPAPEAPKRKRLNIVDVTPAPEARPSPPMAEVVPEGPVVGWGKHAAKPLAALTAAELAWYESDAARKASTGDAEWVERLAAYRAEGERRQPQQAAEVTP